MELVTNTIEDLPAISKKLIDYAKDSSVWLFYGDMGAGKTSLIKHICQGLGVIDSVSSPTYSLVNEYLTSQNESVYHFDFYRIKDEREAEEIGLYDYLDSGNYCLIEWPERISSLLDGRLTEVTISVDIESQKRSIQIATND